MSGNAAVPFAFRVPELAKVAVKVDRYEHSPDIALHHHPAFELVLVRGSSGKRLVGDSMHVYHGGDLVLVGPHLPHAWIREDRRARPRTLLVALFSRESLGLDLLDRPEMCNIRRLLDRAQRGIAFPLAALPDQVRMLDTIADTRDPAERLLRFLLLLNDLASVAGMKPLVSPRYDGTRTESEYRLLVTVLDYLRKNSHRLITLEEMARLARVSVPTFTRFFRRMTGHSFVDYLNRWRIDRACVLLRETNDTILAVSLTVGYNSLAHFNRQFRRWRGGTPRDFRRVRGPAPVSTTPAT